MTLLFNRRVAQWNIDSDMARQLESAANSISVIGHVQPHTFSVHYIKPAFYGIRIDVN